MTITNKKNLPQALVTACEKEHVGADYSVTQLLKGVCEIVQEKRFKDQCEFDVADNVNALFGTAVHNLLQEKTDDPLILSEHYMQDTFLDGVTVSGIADVIDIREQTIKDYKTCSVWKVKFSDYKDWWEQLRSYLYLWYVETGMLWKTAQIVALIKDYSQTDAERDNEYPQSPIVSLEFHYTEEEIKSVGSTWHDKLAQVEDILRGNAELTEPCTPEERWAKPTTWAVMKEGRKTAVRVFQSEEEAQKLAEELGKGHSVLKREGEDTKCKKYCIIGKNGFCPFRSKE